MKLPIAYYLGKHSKAFRLWYNKKTDGKWFWGILQLVRDLDDGKPKKPLTTDMVEKLCDDMNFSGRK